MGSGWMNPRIGISMGDATGIGPEVTLKALAAFPPHPAARYLLLGDSGVLDRVNRCLTRPLDLQPESARPSDHPFLVCQPFEQDLPANLTAGAPEAARVALACLREGARRCLEGDLQALVTAPVNKEAIARSGEPFVGQTEFLSDLAGTTRTAMMLLGEDDRGRVLRVLLVTTHLPLREVADRLTQSGIRQAIELAAQACQELRMPRRRIAVCGLNPHAGEGGLLGWEESRVIAPAVRDASAQGLEVVGPLPADTLFHLAYRGEYDVVVAMYHDQGLAPLKMIGFESGVNWTVGLPFVRTSPDHGTAYDIAGLGRANPASMQAALRLAQFLIEPAEAGITSPCGKPPNVPA